MSVYAKPFQWHFNNADMSSRLQRDVMPARKREITNLQEYSLNFTNDAMPHTITI